MRPKLTQAARAASHEAPDDELDRICSSSSLSGSDDEIETRRRNRNVVTALSRPKSHLQMAADIIKGEDKRPDSAALRQIFAATVRGALVGGSLKGGVTLVGLLAKRKHRDKTKVSGVDTFIDTLRFALWLASFAGGFRALEFGLQRKLGRKSDPYRAALAGLLVGPTFMIADGANWNAFATYVSLRAALLGLRMGDEAGSPVFSTQPFGFRYGSTALMCISASAILSGWILEPWSLPASYVKFLTIHGGKGPEVVAALREMAVKQQCSPEAMKGVRQWYERSCPRQLAALPDAVGTSCDPCCITHAGVGHFWHALDFLWHAFPRAIPVYVPVYAVSIALVQRSQIFRDPQRVIWRAALGVARSSLFLSAYCSSAWLSTCLLHHIAGKRPITRTTITACTLLPGLASLIEKPSRRTELAIYCLGLALQSAGRRASRSGKAPRLRRVDALLISLSSATIMHCYLRHPETFGAKYKNVFDWIFGFSFRRKSFASIVF